MNAIAANELGVTETTDSAPPHWSPADDLLVWTVSRIDGGRRHGVEPDCHVVYALTPTHFVEQTRRFRASAQQCIELLLSGKRAGRTQRKIELNTVMALHSDPRSGRLSIRTLNGTHYLEPVNSEEADILREIAGEIDVRIPPGGAHFSSMVAFGTEPRSYSAEEDRRAAVAVDHARAEDEPDTVEAPRYELPVTPVTLPPQVEEYIAQTELAAQVQSPYAEAPPAVSPDAVSPYAEAPSAGSPSAGSPVVSPYAEAPSAVFPDPAPAVQSPYAADPAATVAETLYQAPTQMSAAAQGVPAHDAPDDVASNHGAAEPVDDPAATTGVPSDITVAGGLAITFQPAPGSVPASTPRYTPDAATIARIQESPYVSALAPTTEWQASLSGAAAAASFAAPAESSESTSRRLEPTNAPGPDTIADSFAPQDLPEPDSNADRPHTDGPHADVYQGEMPQAAAPTDESEAVVLTDRRIASDPSFPAAFDRRADPAFRRQLEKMNAHLNPTPPAVASPYVDAADQSQTGVVDQAMTASEMYIEQPNTRAAAPPAAEVPPMTEQPIASGRRDEDSPFPSVFDRRSLRTASEEVPGWLAPDEDDDTSVSDAESGDEEATTPDLPAGPPVIGPPVIGSSGPSPVSGGGAIGFNPDFDVNPFR